MVETWTLFLGQEDPLEKEMATHSSILAWEIPWTEEPAGLQAMGSQRVRHGLVTEQQQSTVAPCYSALWDVRLSSGTFMCFRK